MYAAGRTTDPVGKVADMLREKKGVPFQSAKLEGTDGEVDYQEYFRGKDLLRYIQANPGKVDAALKEKSGRSDEETASELTRLLISRGLIQRTERKYKRPKPGRTRLVKWPRTLMRMQDQSWDEMSFYVWNYDRPTSMWYYLGIGAIPVVVIAACLFPLAPMWARMAVVYILSGILMILLGIIALRYAVFFLIWMLSGHSFWLFPNIMSETAGIVDAFRPMTSFSKGKSMLEGWKTRVACAVLAGSTFWLLASHSPDMSHLKEEALKAHDSLYAYMESMYGRNQTSIGGNSTSQGPANSASSKQQPGAGHQKESHARDSTAQQPGGHSTKSGSGKEKKPTRGKAGKTGS